MRAETPMASEHSLRFRYKLNDGELVLDTTLELRPGQPCLVVNENTRAFQLLGGVLAGMVPMERGGVPWVQVRTLLRPYIGTLEVPEGRLPDAAYVGPDPDQQLLFSRVEDNFRSVGMSREATEHALGAFGLGPGFLHRKLTTLSGGERMRVALSLCSARTASCYVLHGVVPWLDSAGRACLLSAIRAQPDSSVILLEHEVDELRTVAKYAYRLNGSNLDAVSVDEACTGRNEAELRAPHGGRNAEEILCFDSVSFARYPGSESSRSNPLLGSVSFSVTAGHNYAIVGANGSGKSTIARLALNLLPPDKGTISLCGSPIQRMTRSELLARVAYLSQYPLMQLPLPVVGAYRDPKPDNGGMVGSWLPGLDDVPVVSLSPLQQKLLVLASNVRPTTRVLVLDEPTWGLSPRDVDMFLERVHGLVEEGVSVLAISHNDGFSNSLGANVMHLRAGRLPSSASGTPSAASPIEKERFVRAMLFRLPMWIKAAGLLSVAAVSFGFVFFVTEVTLLTYCVAVSMLAVLMAGLLAATVRRSEFMGVLSAWVLGTLLYVAMVSPMVVLGVTLSPYIELKADSARWLYALSHPVRLLGVMAAGLVFFECTSPLQIGLRGTRQRHVALLFRAVEYCKEALLDTVTAMVMLDRWPQCGSSRIKPREAWMMLRRAPEVVGAAIRNTLLWGPWAWMCMTKTFGQPDKNSTGGMR